MLTNLRWAVTCFSAGALIAGCSQSGALDAVGGSGLQAKLVGANGAAGLVEFNQEEEHRELMVEVTGGQPGATIELLINGVAVLSLTLDESGDGHFKFDSDPDEVGESRLPGEFDGPDQGDDVQVGDMSGIFNQLDDVEADDSDDGQTDDMDDGNAGDNSNQSDDIDDGPVDDLHDGDADDLDDGAVQNGTDDDQVNNSNDGEAADADQAEIDD